MKPELLEDPTFIEEARRVELLYKPNVLRILALVLLDIEQSSSFLDKECATDFTITLREHGHPFPPRPIAVASRIRSRTTYRHPDERGVWIRKTRVNERNPQEMEKLATGFGDYYVYMWGNSKALEPLFAWVLLDLELMRSIGMFEKAFYARLPESTLPGSFFTRYTLPLLRKKKVIVAEMLPRGFMRRAYVKVYER